MVGEFLRDGGLGIVADTKLWDARNRDLNENRHHYETAIQKLVLLNRSVCVGIAGSDPEGVIRRLMAEQDLRKDALVEFARRHTHADFLIGISHPDQSDVLLAVKSGAVQNPVGGRVWIGDQLAYSAFQARHPSSVQMDHWPGADDGFALLASLTSVVTMNTAPTVGGYVQHLVGRQGRFGAPGLTQHIGPEEAEAHIDLDSRTLRLRSSSSESHTFDVLAGADPTFRAAGFLFREARIGLLVPHQTPWRTIRLAVSSRSDFRSVAFANHSQHLR